MHQAVAAPLITTIQERCRMCYTCVRECPAKAISISNGQAYVITDRCIGCGNCVRVCSQHAKRVLRSVGEVRMFINAGARTAACLAPSFPAEFHDLEPQKLVGMVRKLGFTFVHEVAFGADLVADRYHELLTQNDGRKYIATTCPAATGFVARYYPASAVALSPIVSPMVATARALREIYGYDLKIVFIGPCIAKKAEAYNEQPGEVDSALTFSELREMFAEDHVDPEQVEPSEFDPPLGGVGMLFPISRGMLQTAKLNEDLLESRIIAADGRRDFAEAIREFDSGDLDVKLLEVLCCNGCIMGPGMTSQLPQFRRRAAVSQYARQKLARLDMDQWRRDMKRFETLDLHRKFPRAEGREDLYSWLYSPMFSDLDLRKQFSLDDGQTLMPTADELTEILHRLGKFAPEDELNCGACGYDTCREHAVAIYKGLAEIEMCLPFSIELLRKTVKELDISHRQLAEAQVALIQSEKLASMGQLAAGVAHEVNNPLGVVLMYAHILLDECPADSKLYSDLRLIVDQADRCKKIVANLLDFARQNRVVLMPTDIRALADAAVRALPPPDGIHVEAVHDVADPIAELDKDQITQVVTNLISNSFAAMEATGGSLTVRTEGDETNVRFIVSDTGCGIPKENLHKIFEPFFTTKKMGKGTGLGLAVTYGIVKMHRGGFQVKSNADPAAGPTGTTITVTLPRQPQSG